MNLLLIALTLPIFIGVQAHEERYYDDLGPNLGIYVQSVQEACSYTAQYLAYEETADEYHRADYWQRPDVTMAIGMASCASYALVVLKILEESGLGKGQLAIVRGLDGRLHAVVAYRGLLWEPERNLGLWPPAQSTQVLYLYQFDQLPHIMWAINDSGMYKDLR